ncbi:MAG: RNA methyltransferase [Gammaproteobacteria bacterium]|nr:RNA methyltransferase [Gammaproteobacteria bacterium]MCW8972750.1 RNA methyltransferase [Gammaproteobacteria bacterium]MCW8994039.1 RNA methyltransferase [Gammaproteobacteria bacterium]
MNANTATPGHFPRIRIVMVETSHPGNIGAAARAMKNMALERLYLVNPVLFPHREAVSRSSGAEDLLERAVICDTLAEALEGCSLVFGASARSQRTIPWPQVDVRGCAAIAAERGGEGEVAVLFGREDSGLSNEELELCNYLVHIPTNPNYSSLNVAAAIQVVAYELYMARIGGWQGTPSNKADLPASADEVEGFFQHLQQTLVAIDFLDPDNPRQLMRRLRRLFNRVELEKVEVNILRGILTSVNKLLK